MFVSESEWKDWRRFVCGLSESEAVAAAAASLDDDDDEIADR